MAADHLRPERGRGRVRATVRAYATASSCRGKREGAITLCAAATPAGDPPLLPPGSARAARSAGRCRDSWWAQSAGRLTPRCAGAPVAVGRRTTGHCGGGEGGEVW